MGYVESACKFTDDQVREIRHRYNKVRLIKNQMNRIKKEIDVRQQKLSLMREEIKECKLELLEEFDISISTLWNIGEGFSRRNVKE